jgi:hypothetical protein
MSGAEFPCRGNRISRPGSFDLNQRTQMCLWWRGRKYHRNKTSRPGLFDRNQPSRRTSTSRELRSAAEAKLHDRREVKFFFRTSTLTETLRGSSF